MTFKNSDSSRGGLSVLRKKIQIYKLQFPSMTIILQRETPHKPYSLPNIIVFSVHCNCLQVSSDCKPEQTWIPFKKKLKIVVC